MPLDAQLSIYSSWVDTGTFRPSGGKVGSSLEQRVGCLLCSLRSSWRAELRREARPFGGIWRYLGASHGTDPWGGGQEGQGCSGPDAEEVAWGLGGVPLTPGPPAQCRSGPRAAALRPARRARGTPVSWPPRAALGAEREARCAEPPAGSPGHPQPPDRRGGEVGAWRGWVVE